MTTPIEQRKDLLEIGKDLQIMISYRKAILNAHPRLWVLIHHNHQTNNYGLEVNNPTGSQCTTAELDKVKNIIRECKIETIPVVSDTVKKTRKKRVVKPS
jgi:hypothetical protein